MSAGSTEPPAVVFASATDDDVTEIASLVQSAYRGDDSRQGWTTEADFLEGQRVDEPMVREILIDHDAMILTARIDGRLVGCCELRLHDSTESTEPASQSDDGADVGADEAVRSAYLGMFAVDPGLQAAGMGRRILAEAERRVIERWAAKRLVITVISVREELISWYERRGFHLTGVTLPFPYDDQRFGLPLREDLEFVELARDL